MSASCADGFLSVVVPVHNGADTLPACLAALRDQTVPSERYEIIVVDDGSSDDSAEVAAGYGTRIIRQAHCGAAAARNAGILAARGDVVLFTDADCAPARDWVEQLAATIADATRVVSGAKGAYRTRQRGLIPRFVQLEYEDRYDRTAQRATIDFVDTYSAAYRRSVLLEAGGFDESLPGAAVEDVDLSFRLAASGHCLVFNPRAIVYHRHPWTLWRYLRRKAGYGYWRAAIYARHPTKTGGDSHTPPILRWQLGLVAASLLCWPWLLWLPGVRWLCLVLIAAFSVTALPFALKAFRRDRALVPISLVLLWLRAGAIGLGLAWAIINQRALGCVRRREAPLQLNSPVEK